MRSHGVPDADAAVENPKDNFGVYKTATGSYIVDTADLAVGAYADDPTLLVKQTVSRSKTTTSLHNFKYTPTGAVSYAEGVVCTIRIQKESGLEITLLMWCVPSHSLTLVNYEMKKPYTFRFDGDGNVGDIITDTYFNIPDSNADIDDPMDNWGLYKTETNTYLIDVSGLYTGSLAISPTILVNETVSGEKLQNLCMNLNIYQFHLLKIATVITLYSIKIKRIIGIFSNSTQKVYFKIVKYFL